MKKNKLSYIMMILTLYSLNIIAQDKLSFENIRSIYLRNSGTILENKEIKGYYFFYESDKIDKSTLEYTIQILDNNLNKVKDIKFQGDKNLVLLEGVYNGSSIMFLLMDIEDNKLEFRSYGFDGVQKSSFIKDLNVGGRSAFEETYGIKNEDGRNSALFDVSDKGFVSAYPLDRGAYKTFEVDFFFAGQKKQWAYKAEDNDNYRQINPSYLGCTDSLLIFQVTKKEKLLSPKSKTLLLALNLYSGKKKFEIDTEMEDYKFYPLAVLSSKEKSEFNFLCSYYPKDADMDADRSLGLATISFNSTGKIISKKYNSWEKDFSRFVKIDEKSRIEDIGYPFIHNMLQTADGKIFAIAEGYRRVGEGTDKARGSMVGLMLGAGGTGKIKTTEMLLFKFNKDFQIEAVNSFEKTSNSFAIPNFLSLHHIAQSIKQLNGFDYEFTQVDRESTRFTLGYNDYEKGKSYKGETFNTVSYEDGTVTKDKINLSSKASWLKVFPAKTGSIMIMEYFKKDKRLEMRLEKMN